MGMKLLYIGKKDTCIVQVREGLYYYGNGDEFNSFGSSPLKYLRFNPYLHYVEDDDQPIPEASKKWILDNMPE